MAKKTRPRTYHHGDLREALIAAGTGIIAADGPAGFTLRECARRAGVSHAAPRNHFASAEELVMVIAARGWEQFHAALELAAGLAGPAPEARLAAMGQAYVAFALQRPGLYSLMFRTGDFDAVRQGKAGSQGSMALESAAAAAWLQLVEAVTAVTGPSPRVELAALHVWSLVHGLASLSIDGKMKSDDALRHALQASLAALPNAIRGIAAGPAAAA
jgi:AcrR family transcriptional regulator